MNEYDLTNHITANFGRKVRRMVQQARRAGEVKTVTHDLVVAVDNEVRLAQARVDAVQHRSDSYPVETATPEDAK